MIDITVRAGLWTDDQRSDLIARSTAALLRWEKAPALSTRNSARASPRN
jgi:hypothetical protein